MKDITDEHLDRGEGLEGLEDPHESVLRPAQLEDGGVRGLLEGQLIVLAGHPERKRS